MNLGINSHPTLLDGVVTVVNPGMGVDEDDVFETALVLSFSERLKAKGGVGVHYGRMNVDGPRYIKWPSFTSGNSIFLESVMQTSAYVTQDSFNAYFHSDYQAYEYIGSPSMFITNEIKKDRKKSYVSIFYNKDKQSTVIFTVNEHGVSFNTSFGFHMALAFISVIAPWIFDGGKPTGDEMKFLKPLSENDMSVFRRLYCDYMDSPNTKRKLLVDYVKGFGTSSIEERIVQKGNEIKEAQDAINDCMNKIAKYTSLLEDFQAEYMAILSQKEASSYDDELLSFLVSNKAIRVLDRQDNGLKFIVETVADVIDEEMFDRYIARDSFTLLKNHRFSEREMRLFWKAVYKTHKFKIHTYAVYILEKNARLTPLRETYFQTNEKAIPNPHISHYSCVGSYATFMSSAMKEKNFIGALMTAVSITKSLNFSDGIVMDKFRMDLGAYMDTSHFIETRDGNFITLVEAMDVIRKEGIE